MNAMNNMGNKWYGYYNEYLNDENISNVLSFHNKTTWIISENNIPIVSNNKNSWIEENEGYNITSLPQIPIDSIDLKPNHSPANKGSYRKFTDTEISYECLSTLISDCFCSNKGNFSRSYPSAGAMYSVTPLLYIFRSTSNLRSGVYVIDSINKKLLMINDTISNQLKKAIHVSNKKEMLPSSYAIGYAVNINNAIGKYGVRGYRHALIESGAMAQSFRINCNKNNLGEFCSSAFEDFPLAYESGLNIKDFPIILIQWFGRIDDI